MRTKIVWAELHAPLFFAGVNLGQKLDHKTKGGVSMEYCEDRHHLYITYNGFTARVPETSVLSMIEAPPDARQAVAAAVKEVQKPTFDPNAAQVESPQSHVFAGPGGGQTGQEPPKKTAMQEAFEKGGAHK
ncbi:MAG: hypothetical protein V4641_09820 [Pseudomonadota bacterium]